MGSQHLKDYLDAVPNADLEEKIQHTVDIFDEKVMSSFSGLNDEQVLLFGDVQSGKTSHMLGVLAHCLDQRFPIAIVLTSDNTRLVDQTHDRIANSLKDVLVLNRSQTDDFAKNLSELRPRPVVIVMGKNQTILDNWIKKFETTGALRGRQILIIDDEADAASLNTRVNQGGVSTINEQLSAIRHQATGCIYLQVTATPQAVILQSKHSGWSAEQTVFFEPGSEYVGGELFFDMLPNNFTTTFGPSEHEEENNLKIATHTHLITSAFFKLEGWNRCNMLVHPSHRQSEHEEFEKRIRAIVLDTFQTLQSAETLKALREVHDQLGKTYTSAPSFSETIKTLASMEKAFRYYRVNSDSTAQEEDWEQGFNFIVGGNSLGRGLTFGSLQTVFYTRESKNPQADTMWQHARMFGYDRHKPTMRLFLPNNLAKVFSEIYHGNEVLKHQLKQNKPISELRVVLENKVMPTRSNVIDKNRTAKLIGGVNYFAQDPVISDFSGLDEQIQALTDKLGDDMSLHPRAVAKLTEYFETTTDDLDLPTFRIALEKFAEDNRFTNARVIVRRGRKVSHGTGVLLSPNDQSLTKGETTKPLLVLYRIEGVSEKAREENRSTWSSDPIWVPNIKLPEEKIYWRVDS